MLSLPDSSCQVSSGHSKPDSSFSSFKLACLFGQALDLLVSVRLTCHHAYTPDLSTLSSLRGLTCLRNGKSHLEVGFTLRCLQRLSLPHLATQLCHWRDNWSTIDASQRVTEAPKDTLSLDGNQAQSAKAKGCLTARPTSRAGTKVGLSDPAVLNGKAVAQRIKATLGITG